MVVGGGVFLGERAGPRGVGGAGDCSERQAPGLGTCSTTLLGEDGRGPLGVPSAIPPHPQSPREG